MLFRLTLVAATLVAFAPLPPAQEILDDLAAVHPFSLPGALASDPDGHYLFVAEGGALVTLHAETNPDVFRIRSSAAIGATGVRPVRMLLDPDAHLTLSSVPGFEDVLYVAGGRSGLWAMRADLRLSVTNRVAVRIDDSRDTNPATQDSRRWCNDVNVMTVGGVQYLVALFSQRGGSRLRVYCLDNVRAAVATGVELGGELEPLYDLPLAAHPAAATVQSLADADALAYALDVDPGVQPGVQADVYIAMGPHGLVRVHFRSSNFPAAPCDLPWSVTPQSPFVEWGPVYGTGTWAHTSSTPASRRHWYSDFEYDVGDPDFDRCDPPFFIDLAVQSFPGGGRYLYAVVEHRGWVRYRLGFSDPWSDQVDVEHHEGLALNPADHPWGQTHVQVVPPAEMNGNDFLYPVRLDVVRGANGRVALVVSAQSEPSPKAHGHLSESAALAHVGNAIAGVQRWDLIRGDHARTLVYEVPTGGFAGVFNYATITDAGGVGLCVPQNQAMPGEIRFFAGAQIAHPVTHQVVETFSTFRLVADLSANPPPPPSFTHRRNDPIGRFNFGVGFSVVDPDVLLTGTNDGQFHQNGFLTTCPATGEIVAHYDEQQGCPGASCGNDLRGSSGILFANSAQWAHDTLPDVQYLWGAGRPPGESQSVWRIARIDVGSERCNPAPQPPGPDVTAEWYVKPPPDGFGGLGRGTFQTATTDAAYNAEHDRTAAGWEVVFASRVGTPDGVVALRRDVIEAYFETGGPGGGALPSGAVLDLDPNHHPPPIANPVLAQLDTHPELANVPRLREPGSPGDFMFQNPAIANNTLTVHPRLFKLPGPGSQVPDTWVLGVPCATVASDPDVFAQYPPAWGPSPPLDGAFNRALVQFWTVQDPAAITPASDLRPIIGADDFGTAFFLETLAIDLDPTQPGEEVYCFVADFGGRVLAYDVTRMLQPMANQPVLVERWLAPPAVSDALPSNVFNIAVDVFQDTEPRVYVYVPVLRNGIAVLSFDPGRPPGQRLLRVQTIQTPGETTGVTIREDASGAKTLLVSDHVAGIRIYGLGP